MKDVITENYQLMFGDCLERMKEIPNGSIDLILTDPPYQAIACKWDSMIPFEPMWEQLKRIIKPNGAIVLFGSEPFSSALRMSNIKQYKYDWVWIKNISTNFLHAKRQPLRNTENIHVFYKKCGKYYPIKSTGHTPTQKPVALLEYLIKTYTQENETVLDFTAGSFSTGVACLNTNRKFLGIEMDEKYFNIGVNRMCDTEKDCLNKEIK